MTKKMGLYLVAMVLFCAGCSLDATPQPEKKEITVDETPALPDVPDVTQREAKSAQAALPPAVPDEELSTAKASEDETAKQRAKWEKWEKEMPASPFDISIRTAYLDGACARGPVPEKRSDTRGITTALKGQLTYTGKDLLMEASLEGALVIDVHGTHLVEVPFNMEGGKKRPSTAILRMVRGADPWVAGQSREFVLETLPLSEAFCEFVPKSVSLNIAVQTFGAVDGKKLWPVASVPIHFDETVGMALDAQVQLIEGEKFVPAAAHAARFNQMLVTTLDGTTQWRSRSNVAYLDGLRRADGASFPRAVAGGDWKINVKGISSAREFENVAPAGEDEFVALVPLSITNISNQEKSLDDVRLLLEVAPDEWKKPMATGFGKMSASAIAAGKSVDTTAVFLRNRFERPTRLEVDISGTGSIYVNVFSYEVGPERSPLNN
ncbi:MAG: hypothetical protein JXR76_17390 [Deltaproteobacteria bacterium]|nr:hypothetical protein [Deltaproteobacteria bacterium]